MEIVEDCQCEDKNLRNLERFRNVPHFPFIFLHFSCSFFLTFPFFSSSFIIFFIFLHFSSFFRFSSFFLRFLHVLSSFLDFLMFLHFLHVL